MSDYLNEYKTWCESPVFDDETKKELLSIKDDDKEIYDRFYKTLEFGTGGIRGVIGAGINRLNIYTIRRATQGLADYINRAGFAGKGVCVAYDSRRMSIEFSREACLVLNANGIKTFRFTSLRPTPELSFALRELKCVAGIVITASHNPAEYNGYKVYWEDGAQITPPHDTGIIEKVNAISDYASIKVMDEDAARKAGLYNDLADEMDDRYMEALKGLVLRPELIRENSSGIKIVYTPLHGTGNIPVRRVLSELGFENVYVVSEQEKPDGEFPTVPYPNPEDPNAFRLALELAKKVDADIILATDPDADRLGIYAKDVRTGEYVSFTGNMCGSLLCDYRLLTLKELGKLPKNGAIVKTIVTTRLISEMADEYRMKLFDVLTGFKYIGEKIREFESSGDYTYVFGLEESYGCLPGTYARDKDACAAVMCLCEAACYFASKGLTLWDRMLQIYEEYGYFRESAVSITMKGAEGAKEIAATMDRLRNNPPCEIGGYKVKKIADYKLNVIKDLETGNECPTGLAASNVLLYTLSDGAWCCARPSGTEPKIKFYFGVKSDNLEDADKLSKKLGEALLELAK